MTDHARVLDVLRVPTHHQAEGLLFAHHVKALFMVVQTGIPEMQRRHRRTMIRIINSSSAHSRFEHIHYFFALVST